MASGRLTERVAIVTGGSSGIGRAITLRLAQQGATVVYADVQRDPREGGSATEDVAREHGGEVSFMEADASRWEDVDRLVSDTVADHGRVDIMVNNAGIAGEHSKSALETREHDWDAIMQVNLRGVFLCCKRSIAQMLEQEPIGEIRGRVVNVSSQYGMVGAREAAAYGASKGGVVNLTRQLAVDYGRHRVLVNAVAPGKIMTGAPEEADPRIAEVAEARTPFFRLGRPDDVAGAALFLASDDARYVSGINLLVDGGWMAY